MDKTPIYPYPAAYARKNGELEQYRASMKSLAACKCAIRFIFLCRPHAGLSVYAHRHTRQFGV